MPEHIWSVLCYKGCLDSYTKSVSLLDVIESITLRPREPVPKGDVHIPIQMNLVSLWTRSDLNTPETFETRIHLEVPDRSAISAKKELTADLQNHVRIRTFIRFETFPYRGPGLYKFIVEYRSTSNDPWREVASIPLDVRVEQMAAEAPATPTRDTRKHRASRGIAKKL